MSAPVLQRFRIPLDAHGSARRKAEAMQIFRRHRSQVPGLRAAVTLSVGHRDPSVLRRREPR
jgi:hypothetical protein